MLQWLKTRSNRKYTARQLYGSSVAVARAPVFYRDWGVADTLEGRFEMVALHVALLLRRLTSEGAAGKALGQAVLEEMVAALDDDMRELAVSDLKVSKKVQAAAGAFFGRLRAYDEALKSADPADLQKALARNVPGSVAAERLAAYVRLTATALESQSYAALLAGTVSFPAPGVTDSAR